MSKTIEKMRLRYALVNIDAMEVTRYRKCAIITMPSGREVHVSRLPLAITDENTWYLLVDTQNQEYTKNDILYLYDRHTHPYIVHREGRIPMKFNDVHEIKRHYKLKATHNTIELIRMALRVKGYTLDVTRPRARQVLYIATNPKTGDTTAPLTISALSRYLDTSITTVSTHRPGKRAEGKPVKGYIITNA